MSALIGKYTDGWKSGRLKDPLVIYLGGYCGTGKSTLVRKIQDILSDAIVIQTGVVRAILCSQLAKELHPYMYYHSYELVERFESNFTEAFQMQCNQVCTAVNWITRFGRSERQMLIIDGNHLLPGLLEVKDQDLSVQIYLKVADPEAHKKMLCGPTHNRELTTKQFLSARKLQDFVTHEVRASGCTLHEWDVDLKHITDIVEESLVKYFDGHDFGPI